ncbi:MAG: hypothetical protein A2600_05250 [Candidatus Lambdaproteobacteria bacterium RIFOXYD1_FULL_56_27]|uniref:SSD domain-containing protein n=1 Tax=Candidatus Lambdaproteobacteria bacterium RIFOXYD2_FULL_56_26 TaxID=1817773 RepID=A0A1F6GRG8_9PROT|nr:MAG: hypothetical protein A2426_08105 [Candidatus Lambdaproteobacteria bacterium RIFOXYC1_FULL_56_13]OGH00776.1 MAG: hypothetical protein A2557_03635 [Candidatus Lambdaproteobacteria bacterium RIFOXYD2_FULL_56_26]OGH09959.1 MAG: hypothetical protein A2600_05250 [Candidatus Lambdaproteobacteria bacterium RIFOXYD1_FULL_56_27]
MFRRFIDAWAEFVVEKRVLLLLGSLVCAVLVFAPMKNLYFDNSNEMWFLENDPALGDYDKLSTYFGDNEYFMIGIEARPGETVFSKDYIQMTYELTDFLENHDFLQAVHFSELTRSRNVEKFKVEPNQPTALGDFSNSGFGDEGFQTPGEAAPKADEPKRDHPIRAVTKVQSLTTYQATKAKGDSLDVIDLFPDNSAEFTGSDEELAKAAKLMESETLAQDFLLTKDFKNAMISVRTTYLKGTVDHHVALVAQTKAFIQEKGYEAKGFKFHYTGNPDISASFFNASMADQGLTLPLMFLLIILVLITSFRTLAGLTLPLLVVVGSVLTAMSFLAWLGWALNMLNVTLPIILMTAGIGDSVHVLVEFYHFRAKGLSPKESAKSTVKLVFVPCLNTSITTALGFLSIATSKLAPLQEFGLVAGFGVMAAFVITMTLLPALISFSKAENSKEIAEEGKVARMTHKLTELNLKYAKVIVAGAILSSLVALFFASKVEVNANFVDYFKKDAPMRQDLDYFNDTYKGGFYLEFILDSGKDKGILDPAYLKKALEFQSWAESLDGAGKANSLLNMLMQFNQAMHGDDPAWKILPDSSDLAAQYLLLYSNSSPTEDLTDLKTFDERKMRMSLRLVNRPTNQMKVFVQEIQDKVDRDYKDLGITITGMPVLYNNMDSYILEGIVRSFVLSFVSISLCFLVLLRSVKYGLLAMVPALFPILLAGGLMGALGIHLNMAAMIIAAVTFGIAVDNTIHIMSRYIHVRKGGGTRKESIDAAVTETGKALTFTTMILFFGFSILMLSTFVPNIHLGLFGALILAVALLSSLTLLPAMIFLQKHKIHH